MKKLLKNSCSDASLNEPIHVIFERQACLTPNTIALCDNQQQLTYQQLDARANQCAYLLVEQEIKTGDVVALCLERSVDIVITILAILKCGAAYLPLDPSSPRSRLSYILEDAKVNVVLTQNKHVPNFGNNILLVMYEHSLPLPAEKIKLAREPNSQDLAYVLYTSGSTGQPKGVDVRHCGLTNVITYRVNHILTQEERAVIPVTASLVFDASAGQIFTPICSGGKLVVVDNLLEIAKSKYFNEITCIGSTPSVIRAFVERSILPDSLKVLFLGGENVEKDLCELIWQKTKILKLINLYGPTEATIHSSYAILFNRKAASPNITKPKINLPITIGKPIQNARLFILDENLKQCQVKKIGEIYIAGIGLARGYRFREKLTQEKFKTIRINTELVSTYATGDLGIELPNGDIRFLGRTDRQVKIRGYRIELDEVESTLINHELVKQCAVEIVQTKYNKNIVAYLALTGDLSTQHSNLKRIKDHIFNCLPNYMVPHHFVILDQLPFTSNDKLDRKSLPPINQQFNRMEGQYIEPQNDLQNMLADVWQSVLKVDQVSINDRFTDLGGDSLFAVQITTKLKQDFQLDINIGDIFNYPTIASLSGKIQNEKYEYHRPQAILLAECENKSSLFCCSGINIYQALASQLTLNCSTFGLYTPIEDAILNTKQLADSDLPTIKEIAHEYVSIIMEHQDQGPYYLLGISFGGVIAFETARLLKEQGKQVAHLFLLDPVLTSSVHKLPLLWLLTKISEAFSSPIVTISKIKRNLFIKNNYLNNKEKNVQTEISVTTLDQLRQQRSRKMVMAYERTMQAYTGDATLLHASARKKRPGYQIAADCGWSNFIQGRLNICNVESDHLGLLKQPYVKQTAKVVARILD